MPSPAVLVVQPNPRIRDEITQLLRTAGVDYCTAGGLREAGERLESDPVNLCLTDLELGDGTGLQLLEQIQIHHPTVATAVVTAEGSVNSVVSALKAGAIDVLRLPTDGTAIEHFVRDLLNRRASGTSTAQERRTRHILLGNSAVMRRVRGTISKLAQTDAAVFISGESGTGKELAARLIHARSDRCSGPFVAVNCGAIPHDLMESELFGHRRGAFTGASADKVGLFQAATGGTLFLDEVAELSAAMQVKLLRALQQKAVRAVGDTHEQSVNVRVLSATHKDLNHLVMQRAFRKDLFYRINVIELNMPPLRERRDDIPQLVEHILRRLSQRAEMPPPTLSPETMRALVEYSFPGNVRELENVIERALTLCDDNLVRPSDLRLPVPDHTLPRPEDAENLDDYLTELERIAILRALQSTGWNRTRAAKRLGISFRSLRYRLEKLGLEFD